MLARLYFADVDETFEVGDLDEAIRCGGGREGIDWTWRLVAAHTLPEAEHALTMIADGQHPDQWSYERIHQEIRAGLNPDLTAIRTIGASPIPHYRPLVPTDSR